MITSADLSHRSPGGKFPSVELIVDCKDSCIEYKPIYETFFIVF